jgi:hypothetical protein
MSGVLGTVAVAETVMSNVIDKVGVEVLDTVIVMEAFPNETSASDAEHVSVGVGVVVVVIVDVIDVDAELVKEGVAVPDAVVIGETSAVPLTLGVCVTEAPSEKVVVDVAVRVGVTDGVGDALDDVVALVVALEDVVAVGDVVCCADGVTDADPTC